MIDNLVLAMTHGLMLLAAWRLLFRPDLNDDGAPRAEKRGWFERREPKESDDA